jgi:hydrogenase maturation protease
MTKTLVLGLGNTLFKDDGLGVRAIDRLKDANLSVEIRNGATLGLGLFEILKSAEKTIVVDAVEMGKAPGTVARFTTLEVLSLPASQNFSLHEIGLLEVLKIGKSLNEEFNNVIIIGVQPKDIAPGEGLSEEVEGAVLEVLEMIRKEVI